MEVCETTIAENVAVAESPSLQRDVFSHNGASTGARDYRALYEEPGAGFSDARSVPGNEVDDVFIVDRTASRRTTGDIALFKNLAPHVHLAQLAFRLGIVAPENEQIIDDRAGAGPDAKSHTSCLPVHA